MLSGGAAKSLVDPMAASFEGGKVQVQYQPMGRLVETLAQGAEDFFRSPADNGSDIAHTDRPGLVPVAALRGVSVDLSGIV